MIKVHKLVADTFIPITDENIKTVDHINGDKLDNKLENLERVSHRENCSRGWKMKKTTSKYTGVYHFKRDNKWVAQINIGGETNYLGLYDTEMKAHKVYQKKLKELDGNIARNREFSSTRVSDTRL